MQPEYLIIGASDIHEKLLDVLAKARIEKEKVLIIAPDDPKIAEIMAQFTPDNQLVIDEFSRNAILEREFKIEPVQLPKIEVRPIYRQDPHPHIPKHLKRKYPRR